MKQDISQSIVACAAHYGEDADAMRDYLIEGEEKLTFYTTAARFALMRRVT